MLKRHVFMFVSAVYTCSLDQLLCLLLVATLVCLLTQSLLLLHYLLRNGSERVVSSAREHIYDMKPLEEYTFRDEHGKDQGINGQYFTSLHPSIHTHTHTHTHYTLRLFSLVSVRQKAKEIISFIQDDERLKDARKQAKQTRDKYVGYSSEAAQHRYSE